MSEINLKAGNSTEQRVLDYLTANASEILAEKINAGKKTLAGALDYAKEEARKLAKGESCAFVEDATVFGWIVHFFEEEHIEEKDKKPKIRTPAGVKPAQEAKSKEPGAKAAAEANPAKSAKGSGHRRDSFFQSLLGQP